MPYRLRKVPKKELYWVVSKETGKKHSKEGLPKDRAKAQMKALYAAESGAVMKGEALPTMKTSTLSTIARMGYKTGNELLTNVDGWELFEQTPNLRFYRKDGEMIVAVRGSKTLSDWTDSNTRLFQNKVREGQRYKDDRAAIERMLQYAPVMYGVGHSLGGALLDEFIKDGLVKEAVSFNPAVQPENWENEELAKKNTRVYYEGDPVYEIMGRYTTGSQVVKARPDDWIVEYATRFPNFKNINSIPTAVKELMKTRIGILPAGISLYAHQVSRFLPIGEDIDVKVFDELSRGVQSVRGGASLSELASSTGKKALDLVKGATGSLSGSLPKTWTKEQWQYFFKYADAVVFDTLSEPMAKEAVTIILTSLALMPKFQAALAAGLTFWEAVGAILPLVTSAAARAGLTITLPAIGGGTIVVSLAVAIAVFWALYYAHEYLYPGCNEELIKKGTPCNDLRTKSKSINLWEELRKLKEDVDKAEADKKKLEEGQGMPKGNKKAGFVGLMIAKKHLKMKPGDYDPSATPKNTPAKFVTSRIQKPSKYILNAFPIKQRGRPKKAVEALAPTGRFSKAQRDELKRLAAEGNAQAQATLEGLRQKERERKQKKVTGGIYKDEHDDLKNKINVYIENLRDVPLRTLKASAKSAVKAIRSQKNLTDADREALNAQVAFVESQANRGDVTYQELNNALRHLVARVRGLTPLEREVEDASPTSPKSPRGSALPAFNPPNRPTSAGSKRAYFSFYKNYLVRLYTESYVPLLSEKAGVEGLNIAAGTKRLMLEDIDRRIKEVGDRLEEVKTEFVSNYDEKTWEYILGEAQVKAGLKERD